MATIECLEDDGLLENSERVGARALARMQELKEKHQIVGDVRGLGLLLGIELVRDRRTREPAVNEAERVMYDALSKGLSFKVTMGSILTLTPPLTITQEEMDSALDIIDECLSAL